MFKLTVSLVVFLCILQCITAASLETPTKVSGEKTDANKPATEKPATEIKAAASPEEMDKARTHSSYLIDNLVKVVQSRLGQSSIWNPSIAVPYATHSAAYPSYSYQPLQYYPSAPVAAPLVHAPVASVVSSVQAPVTSVLPAVQAPVLPAVHTQVLPAVHTQAAPVAVSHVSVSKPVVSYNQHVVQQPQYAISQQVIHKPIHTEVLEVIRRPVLTEVLQYVHKPVLTELQQVIQVPLYAQHLVKPLLHNSVKQEINQAPLYLQSEAVHVVDSPVSKVIRLPNVVIPPYATNVVQTPVVHQEVQTSTSYHQPAVTASVVPAVSSIKPISTGFGYSGIPFYGSSLYGGASSYGSSFGYPYGSYGSSYGSSYGFPYGSYGSSYSQFPYSYGYSGVSSSYGQTDSTFLTPSSCRATGDCPKDAAEGKDMMTPNTMNVDSANLQTLTPMQTGLPLGQSYSYTPTMYNNNQFPYSQFSSLKNAVIGQPIFLDQPLSSPAESVPPKTDVSRSSEGDKNNMNDIDPLIIKKSSEMIRNDPQLMSRIEEIMRQSAQQNVRTTPTQEEFNMEKSFKEVQEFAKKHPQQWASMYKGMNGQLHDVQKIDDKKN